MAWYFLAVVMGLIALRLIVLAATPRGIKVRPINGKLPDCPEGPTCVSSQAERPEQKVDPIQYKGSPEEAKLRLRLAVESMPGTRIFQDDRVFMHVEFQSLVFGFMHDLEFLIDDTRKLIHVRSASRIGITDFGSNRRQVERIRNLFETIK